MVNQVSGWVALLLLWFENQLYLFGISTIKIPSILTASINSDIHLYLVHSHTKIRTIPSQIDLKLKLFNERSMR